MELKGKLDSSAGFTLVEILATLVIMSLISMIMAIGIKTAYRTYSDNNSYSISEVFLDTISTDLSDEIRYAVKAEHVDGNSSRLKLTFLDDSTEKEILLYLDSNDGYLYIGDYEGGIISNKRRLQTEKGHANITISNISFDILSTNRVKVLVELSTNKKRVFEIELVNSQ